MVFHVQIIMLFFKPNVRYTITQMVEVKGPGDRLSTKQLLWLDYFLGLNVSAEVCHVQGQ
jgi:Fanconi-associated nuclease 1